MARDEGFEPPMPGPEPGALPLGQSLIKPVKLYPFLVRDSSHVLRPQNFLTFNQLKILKVFLRIAPSNLRPDARTKTWCLTTWSIPINRCNYTRIIIFGIAFHDLNKSGFKSLY